MSMKKEKIQENWRAIPDHNGYLLSDLGHVRTIEGIFIETSNGFVMLESEQYSIANLVQKTFIRDKPTIINHNSILNGSFTLRFKHYVLTPNSTPDLSSDGLKMWFTDYGFVCVAPQRSFPVGNCRFIFPYTVTGDRAYLCPFEEITEGSYRMPRNSGTVQIATNKRPVPLRQAIAIIYKEFNKAVKYHSRITPDTKLLKSYASNAVLSTIGRLTPVCTHNDTVYIIYVDYKSLRAEYRELISKQDVFKIYELVSVQSNLLWEKSFGFTKESFLKLVEAADK